MKPIVCIFAREIVPGRTKTRLFPAVGIENATKLYEAFLQDTVLHAKETGFDVELWVAGDPDHVSLTKYAHPRRAQVGDDLGARMKNALDHHTLTGRTALLIGSDAPTLPSSLIEAAAARLEESETVLCPASDGGFVLIGARAPLPSLSHVEWSTDRTLDDTRLALAPLSVALAPAHYDVDEPDDLLLLDMHLQLAPQSAPNTAARYRAMYGAL